MKKEWLFFYVFFIVVLCPAVSKSQLIAKFTCTAANNTVATPVSIDPDQLTAADDASFTLREITDQKNTEASFPAEYCYHRFPGWFVPGNDDVLKYRMPVFDGTITAQQAEYLWKSFTHASQVTISKKL